MSAPAQVEGIYPLSPSQTGMWMQSVAAPGSGIFVEQAAWCLEGALDSEALHAAWQTVMDRHAALRAAVVYKGRDPLLVVMRQVPLKIRRELADPATENLALDALLEAERSAGFTLNRPPLIRFALLETGAERAWWIVTFHHLILDGWSMAVLWSEALAVYAARSGGTVPLLPPAPDYRDFAAWLKARSEATAEQFWRATLAAFNTANPLTGRASNDDTQELARHCSVAAGRALAESTAACRVAPAIVMETLWALLVAGRTASRDVVFGATVAGRPPEVPGIERMVGCFINSVPLRLRFNDNETLRQCIADHAARRAELAEFESCSAGQIHGWSGQPPDQPLYRSLLVFENLPPAAATQGGALPLRITGQRVHGARSAVPLTLLVSPGAAPHLRFVFHPQAIGASAVADIAAELERLLVELPARLDQPVAALCAGIAPAPAPVEDAPQADRPAYVAPRNRLENELCRIWEELFRATRIGVLDDFFSLGGHSLLALQMAAQVRSQLDLDLPLHLLIGTPTIEHLAAALGGESGFAEASGALIAMNSGGSGIPLYCVHPLGGHVLCYTALARRLHGRHPCWGMQAKGLLDGETPPQNWEEIVDHHWSLFPHEPGGAPLLLVGYSYGGYIAMELAERIRSQDGRPVTVVLLDVPHLSVVPAEMAMPSRARLLYSVFWNALQLDLAELEALPEDKLLDHVYDLASAKHILPPGTSRETLARLLDVVHAHSRLQPPTRHYPFPVVLLRAREGAQRFSERDDLGWRDYVAGVELAWVEGSHETMLEAQFIDGLIATLPL